jgi:hypothetical protein
MGIDLTCDTKTFGCSYGGWNQFRNTFVQATIAYLKDFLANQTFDEYDQAAAEYLQKHLQSVEEKANELANKKYTHLALSEKPAKEYLLDSLIMEVSAHNWFRELLIQFGAYGIYAICNKTDCEGFYSVGNSVDICEILEKIIPFLPADEEDHLDPNDSIYKSLTKELLEVFQESVDKKIPVRIH